MDHELAAHLAGRYALEVAAVTRLDDGVFRVERADGLAWIARVFPARRPLAAVEDDAAILRGLAGAGFPAERCADPQPVSTLDGRAVLMTEAVAGTTWPTAPRARRSTPRWSC